MRKAPDARVVERYPLTPLQESFLATTLDQPRAGYGIPQVICRFDVDVDVDALLASLRFAVACSPVLRTVCVRRDGRLWQEVHDRVEVTLHRIPEGDAALAADRGRGFDLWRECPSRFSWSGERTLVWTVHHIAMDVTTIAQVFTDVFRCYDAVTMGSAPPPVVVRHSFSQYARLAAADDRGAAFWLSYLGDAHPTELGLADHDAVPSIAPGPASVRWTAPTELDERLRAAAAEYGVRVSTLLYAAWALILHRCGASRDVVLGCVMSTREPDASVAVDGPVFNLVPLRIQVPTSMTVREWLAAVRRADVVRRAHLRVPTNVITGDLSNGTLLNIQTRPWTELIDRARYGPTPRTWEIRDRSVFPLVLDAYAGESLSVTLNPAPGRFTPQLLDRLRGWLQSTLLALVEDGSRAVATIGLVAHTTEPPGVLRAQGTHPADSDADACVHHLVQTQARQRTDAVAVVFGTTALSYGELDRQANGLAWLLHARGIGPEAVVGIRLSRSTDLAVAVLGVLKAGAAFLPLDPGLPDGRLDFMVADAGATFVITDADLARLRAAEELTGRPDGPPSTVVADNLAYVIYTSGSTGAPKGVQLTHRGLTNLVRAQAEAFGTAPHDRVLQFAPFSFDACISELFVTWVVGAQLHLATPEQRQGAELAELLRHDAITAVTLPPSALAGLPGRPNAFPALRTLVVAGEACPAPLVDRWAPGVRFINAYGPTEATVCATTAPLRAGTPPVIGVPIDNVGVYLLDDRLEPVPTGALAEIYIGGPGVARGYAGRPASTAQWFLPDPYAGRPGARMYRTGDLGRHRPDGSVEFAGRRDQQVKVRGHRIELGEIEQVVSRHPKVRQTVVVARRSPADPLDIRLVAYITGEADAEAGLRRWLTGHLPPYMIPDLFVRLDAFPLTAPGKVDRRALPPPPAHRPAGDVATTPTQKRLAALWDDLLHLEGRTVGIEDNFFELGGNSLTAMKLCSRLETEVSVTVSVAEVTRAPTIRALAQLVDEGPRPPRSIRRLRRDAVL